MNPVAIAFENVHYSADGLHILKNITGSFPEGKITTLVGPSGAGKPINKYNPIELRRGTESKKATKFVPSPIGLAILKAIGLMFNSPICE